MEAIYIQGILIAESLQQTTKSQEKLWLIASHLGDPKASFLLVFPLVWSLSRRAGAAVLWVAALSEWLNLLLKWMLFGERPFWWIGESRLYDDKNHPQVHQFPSTCETGPGSPSGHAMVTAAVWWVIASSLGSLLFSHTRSVLVSALPYLVYLAMLVAVGLSRIFILAHFPHQVVAGSVTGLVLGVVLNWSVPVDRPLRFFACCSAALLLSAVLLHAALEQAGLDLSWSISLAKKWCSRPEWIHLDTAPFSSLTRDCGSLLGLGLAQHWKPGGWSLSSWAPRSLCLALSSMALYHVHRLPLPVRPLPLFYGLFFLKFVIVPPVVMVFVPGLVQLLTSKKRKD